MKKLVIFALASSLLLSLLGCSKTVVLGEPKQYDITSEIHSLDIHINAADFTIVEADAFLVKSNLKHLSVTEKDGVLSIVDKHKAGISYTDAMLTLYIPKGVVFDELSISTGAARLASCSLSADTVKLQLGAGDVSIASLYAALETDIEGGAGRISISGGTLNNLDAEMGMGEFNLTAALHGKCNLEMGVGEANLTLLGSMDDYSVDIEKGIGSITVDGRDVSSFSYSGNPLNRVNIEGGIGAINLAFQPASIPVTL